MKRLKYRRNWLRQGVASSLLAFLAACGSLGSPQEVSGAGKGYLLTVKINSQDSQTTVAQEYGGEAIAWQPEAGFAILRLSNETAAQLKNRGISMQGTTLEPNVPAATPAVAQGWNTWGGGWNTWAGGWNTWAGGWNTWAGGWNVWAGGSTSIPTIPSENRPAFLQAKLPQAQAMAKNFGSGIKVAVIDTGIDTTHPMFSGRLAPTSEWKDFVDGDSNPQEVSGGAGYGHGTAVSGIILQVAPQATILPLRVLSTDGSGDVANVVSAIDWALQKGVQIINLSLGTDTDVAALKNEISYANSLGIYVITSAGNSGSSMTYPAANAQSAPYSDKLWSVGSVSSSGSRSTFSSYGSALKFSAPGEAIYSAYPNNQVASVKGTSFAAPIVTGTLALAMGETPSSNWSSLQFWAANSTFGAGSTGSLFGIININSYLQKLPGFQRKNALLVVGVSPLNSNDALLSTSLQNLGYTVNPILDKSTTSNVAGLDLIVISPSSDDKQITTKFLSATVPTVVMNRFLYDDMKMVASGAYQSAASQTQIAISNATHPLAAGYSSSVNVYASATSLQWGTPGSGAVGVATVVGNSTRSTIFGYDKGSTMVGMTAPARRVGFFLWSDGATKWSTAGSNLFESAVTWAVSGN